MNSGTLSRIVTGVFKILEYDVTASAVNPITWYRQGNASVFI